MAKPRSRATKSDGVTGALALYLLPFCSIFAVIAATLFWLLQPRIGNNPGLAAYEPPAATVAGSAPARVVSPSVAPIAAAKEEPPAKPVVQADRQDTAPAAEPKVEHKPAKPPKRSRSARKHTPSYAGQRYDNSYNAWGYDRSARRSNGFRPWF